MVRDRVLERVTAWQAREGTWLRGDPGQQLNLNPNPLPSNFECQCLQKCWDVPCFGDQEPHALVGWNAIDALLEFGV